MVRSYLSAGCRDGGGANFLTFGVVGALLKKERRKAGRRPLDVQTSQEDEDEDESEEGG